MEKIRFVAEDPGQTTVEGTIISPANASHREIIVIKEGPPDSESIRHYIANGYIIAVADIYKCARCKHLSARKLGKSHFNGSLCTWAAAEVYFKSKGLAPLYINADGRYLHPAQVSILREQYALPVHGCMEYATSELRELVRKYLILTKDGLNNRIKKYSIVKFLIENGCYPVVGKAARCGHQGCTEICGEDGMLVETSTHISTFCKKHVYKQG